MVKLREAITFLDNSVEERQASAEDHMTKIEEIDITNMTEEEFLEKAITAIGEVKKELCMNHTDKFVPRSKLAKARG